MSTVLTLLAPSTWRWDTSFSGSVTAPSAVWASLKTKTEYTGYIDTRAEVVEEVPVLRQAPLIGKCECVENCHCGCWQHHTVCTDSDSTVHRSTRENHQYPTETGTTAHTMRISDIIGGARSGPETDSA